MTSKEIQTLTNKIMCLSRSVEYNGCNDPVRSFWQGFDTAVEVFFDGIRGLLQDGAWNEVRECTEKAVREITCGTYEKAMRRTSKDVMNFMT